MKPRRRRAATAAILVALFAGGGCEAGGGESGSAARGPGRPGSVAPTHGDTLAGAELAAALGCGACHPGAPGPVGGREAAPRLDRLAERWDPAALADYLVAPTPLRPGSVARMPGFALDGGEAAAVVLYLMQSAGGGGAAERPSRRTRGRLEALARAHPGATAARGRAIVDALNCAGCHRGTGTEPWVPAPSLVGAGARLRAEWLRAYLADPAAVRPFGYHPGSGSRMPDFGLSGAEADSLGAWLRGAPDSAVAPPTPLSPFQVAKAEALLRDHLSCLGCHTLRGEGGRIGPALDRAAGRLRPAHLRRVVEDPAAAVPGTVMPAPLHAAETTDLVLRYLRTRRPGTGPIQAPGAAEAPARRGYLSMIEHAPARPAPAGGSDGAALYARYCAVCHGVDGGGDGFNARYLPAAPTVHADAAGMATRADATLFDGIHGGGHILGRSHRMPGFGATLTRAEVRSLVGHVRALCACREPAWAAAPAAGAVAGEGM